MSDRASEQDAARDERDVRRSFWPKFRKVAAQLPFAEDLVAAYFCAFDRNTPHQVRAVLLGALAYFIMPFDVAPDMLLVLGFADDAAVLAGAVRLMAAHITPAHREAAQSVLRGEVADGA
jgi:uncharacterized membrane protein YkvA (DUF1232 family)